jgi:hypothetical protein
MNNKRWKVTLLLDIEEGSHPRKFVPEAVSMGLNEGEDLFDYKFEEVSNDFEFPSSINNTI